MLAVLFPISTNKQPLQKESKIASNAKKWIYNGDSKIIQAIATADYSQFNPPKQWIDLLMLKSFRVGLAIDLTEIKMMIEE